MTVIAFRVRGEPANVRAAGSNGERTVMVTNGTFLEVRRSWVCFVGR
jgi:hypothetical protein